MDREATRTELKKHLTDYVNRITAPDRKAGHNMYKCPLCGSGTHGGRNSDGALSVTKDGLTWRCFACGKGGDLFDLIGEYEQQPDYNNQLKRAIELFGCMPSGSGAGQAPQPEQPHQMKEAPMKETKPEEQQSGRYNDYIKKCAAAADKTGYLTSRGFTAETISRFHLGYDEETRVIVIPYDEANSYYITRSTEGKAFRKPPAYQAGAEPIYNKDALYTGQPCFICESPIDAISIMQAGGSAAALGGTGFQKLIEQIKVKKPTNALILCFDNDTAGKTATAAAADVLKKMEVPFIIANFTLGSYSGDRKDANDLLRANEDQLKEDIRQNLKVIRNRSQMVSYIMSDYLKGGLYDADISYFKKYQHRKTGFPNIDQYLTLYPGLAALGGGASLGKSTFAVNLADNLIKAGETVLYFALEQEPIELVTKCISRRLYEADPATTLTNIDIKNGKTNDTLEAVKREFIEKDAKRFIILRCNFTITAEEIRDEVENYIKTHGVKPVVFIDYLQLVSPPTNFKGDIRIATDHIVKEFKTMQRDNELFVVMISNFNRASYTAPVSYESFKETGMIEFTCDYVWGLQLSILEDDDFFTTTGSRGGEKETGVKAKKDAIYDASKQNPKEVELVSLKSRNGRQTYKCFFKYNMKLDAFTPDLNSPYDTEKVFSAEQFERELEEKRKSFAFDKAPVK